MNKELTIFLESNFTLNFFNFFLTYMLFYETKNKLKHIQ